MSYFTSASLELVAGMETCPGIQKIIFELSQRLGRILFGGDRAVSYGKTLQALFPDNTQRNRVYFIKELCGALEEQLETFFEQAFRL